MSEYIITVRDEADPDGWHRLTKPAEPLVRCRDCKFGRAGEVLMDGGWKFGDCTNPHFKGSIHACNVTGNGFCAWAEPREGADK